MVNIYHELNFTRVVDSEFLLVGRAKKVPLARFMRQRGGSTFSGFFSFWKKKSVREWLYYGFFDIKIVG